MAMEESEVMMLKAMTEPRGIRESREMMMKVTKTEFRGMWVVLVTWNVSVFAYADQLELERAPRTRERMLLNGSPPSRAKVNICRDEAVVVVS